MRSHFESPNIVVADVPRDPALILDPLAEEYGLGRIHKAELTPESMVDILQTTRVDVIVIDAREYVFGSIGVVSYMQQGSLGSQSRAANLCAVARQKGSRVVVVSDNFDSMTKNIWDTRMGYDCEIPRQDLADGQEPLIEKIDRLAPPAWCHLRQYFNHGPTLG